MYYPIMRGKQYELLALRESAVHLGTATITPLIEPVRDLAARSGAVHRCLTDLVAAGADAGVVLNPTVGPYCDDGTTAGTVLDMLDDVDPHGRIAIAVRLGRTASRSGVTAAMRRHVRRPHVYIHQSDVVDDPEHGDIARLTERITHVAVERSRVRRLPTFRDDPRVAKYVDAFDRAARNADYPDCEPYQFTDWNLFFEDDGYVGYSDYATIGEPWIEGGFTPRSVAIHLTYLSPDDGSIWIQHFVSRQDPDSISNIRKKFDEALGKLVDFANQLSLDNPAISEFRRLHGEEQFPGLGTVKKLSLINHLHVTARVDD